jgi:hypothetical protein
MPEGAGSCVLMAVVDVTVPNDLHEHGIWEH